MKNKQNEIFDELIKHKSSLQNLAGFIQNDFKRLLENEFITKEQINNQILDMEKQFDEFISDIKKLKQETKTILEHYSK